MQENVRNAIVEGVKREPFALDMGMELLELEEGFSRVAMAYDPAKMDNLYARAHGGAIYALVDEAFETASQTEGTIAVAMSVSITYVASPSGPGRLVAEARRVSQTKKTAGFDIRVFEGEDTLIAWCQAVAYRTGKPIPFL